MNAVCSGESASVTWQRLGGDLIAVRQAMQAMPKTVQYQFKDDKFVATLDIISLGEYERGKLLSTLDALSVSEARFGALGELSINLPRSDLGRQLQNQRTTRANAISGARLQILQPVLGVKLESSVSPKEIAGFFDINALQVKRVEWKIPERKWIYETEITVSE